MRKAFPNATIVRPAEMFGHEDRFLRYYASLRFFPFGMIPLLNGGRDVYKRPVYVSGMDEVWGARDDDSSLPLSPSLSLPPSRLLM